MNDNLQHPSGTRRIAWVDYGKGLAILLVFWGHTICPEPIRIFFMRFTFRFSMRCRDLYFLFVGISHFRLLYGVNSELS